MRNRFCLWTVLFFCIAPLAYSQSIQTEEDAIRALIKKFADARNAHDGKSAASTYTEHGKYITVFNGKSVIQGTRELETYWGELPSQAERRIDSVNLLTSNLAIAHGKLRSGFSSHNEVFVLIRANNQWKIQFHEVLEDYTNELKLLRP